MAQTELTPPNQQPANSRTLITWSNYSSSHKYYSCYVKSNLPFWKAILVGGKKERKSGLSTQHFFFS